MRILEKVYEIRGFLKKEKWDYDPSQRCIYIAEEFDEFGGGCFYVREVVMEDDYYVIKGDYHGRPAEIHNRIGEVGPWMMFID